MKKRILGGIFILVIAALAVFNLNLNLEENRGNLLNLANIEALANNESGGSEGFWCSTYDAIVDYYYSYCYDIGRNVITTKYTHRACDNGLISFCYPGQVNYYYNCSGELTSTYDNTYVSTCR